MNGLIGGKSCRSCEHRHSDGGQGFFCKRFPPQVLLVPTKAPDGSMQATIQSAFPSVNPDLPCGEYRRDELAAINEVSGAATSGVVRQ